MKKDKVAIFRSNLLPISETFIRDQAGALTRWEPILLGRRNVEVGLTTPNLQREIVPEHSRWLSRFLHFWRWSSDPNLTNRLKALDVRLVHAHFGTDATKIWPSVKAAGLPMLVTLHGFDINVRREWWEAGHGGLRGRVYPRRLLKLAQDPTVSFIAVSNAIKQRAVEYGIPEDKITVSYIGVDTQRFKPGGLPILQRKKRILFVGRMVEKKAPLMMIHAFAQLQSQISDAELVMVGTGPLLDDAKRLAKTLNANIQFLGSCTSSEVLVQLHQARCFCLPSITAKNGDAEGLPISILEAMACGIPIITSARGAVNEAVIGWRNGICFTELNQNELLSSLTRILTDDLLAISLASSARITAEDFFSIQEKSKELENIYPPPKIRGLNECIQKNG